MTEFALRENIAGSIVLDDVRKMITARLDEHRRMRGVLTRVDAAAQAEEQRQIALELEAILDEIADYEKRVK